MKRYIIPNAIEEIVKYKNVIKFTNKKEFEQVLDKQRYFSLSAAHCFYSEADYQLFHQCDKKFMDGNSQISEANRGCMLKFDCGELVVVWNEQESLGYIVPSAMQR